MMVHLYLFHFSLRTVGEIFHQLLPISPICKAQVKSLILSNFDFFQKWLQPVERLRESLKKTYEVKFCFMQKEISYIRLKKRLPIKSLVRFDIDSSLKKFKGAFNTLCIGIDDIDSLFLACVCVTNQLSIYVFFHS